MTIKRISPKGILMVVAISSFSVAAFNFFQPDSIHSGKLPAIENNYDVRILRDIWGVPHIFGVTDPDVAYGLAYAHAEDDFETIQKSILGARGKLASVLGKEFAPNDYMVQLLRIWDVINSKYDLDLSPDVKIICEAYADGLNHYADLHGDEVYPGLLPVTGKDIVAGFVHKVPLFFGLHNRLKELFEPERKHEISTRPLVKYDDKNLHWEEVYGSNAFAVGPGRSADGETFLAINSHQPWEGLVTWYEAHLRSERGWDMVGGVFPGTPAVMHGHNRYLGWAHTVNSPDLVDIYVLEINPENPNQYRFDGEWRELEVRPAAIKVKLFGPISSTFDRETLWSVYGPVVRRPHGTYAIRYSGMGDVRHVEQWYRMNKARNLDEWQTAMQMMAIPKFNCVYADNQSNIFYVYNGLLPIRTEGYKWSQYLPGNTSETLWTDYLLYSKLPKVLNPACGFLQNCNSSPFRATIGSDNPGAEDYSATLGIRNKMTNRALRAFELFGADESITQEEFYEYKFDMTYSTRSELARLIQKALNAPTRETPIAKEAVEILRSWDLQTNPENTGAALALMAFFPFVRNKQYDVDINLLLESLVETAKELKHRYGRVDVPWQEINRLIRGDKDLGMGGGPDVLHAVYGKKMEDGRFKGFVGDSYILMVTWDKNGQVHSNSIHQYGSATLDESSPHYADQAELFVRRKLKPVWMDEKDIRLNLKSEYRPGEELMN